MKRYSQWGARLFFSATVAFSVPSIYKDGGLLSLRPFWKGLVLTVAAVVGKLVVGLYAGPPLTLVGFLKLGWAMNGRCENRCVLSTHLGPFCGDGESPLSSGLFLFARSVRGGCAKINLER